MNIEQLHDRLWPGSSDIEKRRRLSKFSIAEISAVDKPAQAGAVAVIMKRDDLPDPQKPDEIPRRGVPTVVHARHGKPKGKKKVKLAKLAPHIVERGGTSISKDDFYAEIQKRAAKIREEGETSEQAFARCIEKDAKGKALFAAMKLAGQPARITVDTPEKERATRAGDVFSSADEATLDRLAKDLQNKTPGMSYASAYTAIITMPQHKALFDSVRNDGLVRQLRGIGAMA